MEEATIQHKEANMAVDLKALKNHPGRNPEYENGVRNRIAAQDHNMKQRKLALRGLPHAPLVKVPTMPNKYIPHTGAKELRRHSI